jgi:hypothetical protein
LSASSASSTGRAGPGPCGAALRATRRGGRRGCAASGAGDLLQARHVGRRHRLAARVAGRHEGELGVQRGQFVRQPGAGRGGRPPAMMASQQAIVASRLSTSKRMRISWMRS